MEDDYLNYGISEAQAWSNLNSSVLGLAHTVDAIGASKRAWERTQERDEYLNQYAIDNFNRQTAWQKYAYDYSIAQRKAFDEWHFNQFDSPSAKRAALEAAGLSPYVVFGGNSAAGLSASASSPMSMNSSASINPSSGSAPYHPDYLPNLNDSILVGAEVALKRAQAANLDRDTLAQDVLDDNLNAETGLTLLRSDGQKLANQAQTIANVVAQATAGNEIKLSDADVQIAYATFQSMCEDIQSKEFYNKHQAPAELSATLQNVLLAAANTAYVQKLEEYTQAGIYLTQEQTATMRAMYKYNFEGFTYTNDKGEEVVVDGAMVQQLKTGQTNLKYDDWHHIIDIIRGGTGAVGDIVDAIFGFKRGQATGWGSVAPAPSPTQTTTTTTHAPHSSRTVTVRRPHGYGSKW